MSRSRCRYAKNVTYSVTCVTSQNVMLSGRYEGDEKPPPQPPPSELFWGRRRSLRAFGRGCISAFAGARNSAVFMPFGGRSSRLASKDTAPTEIDCMAGHVGLELRRLWRPFTSPRASGFLGFF